MHKASSWMYSVLEGLAHVLVFLQTEKIQIVNGLPKLFDQITTKTKFTNRNLFKKLKAKIF